MRGPANHGKTGRKQPEAIRSSILNSTRWLRCFLSLALRSERWQQVPPPRRLGMPNRLLQRLKVPQYKQQMPPYESVPFKKLLHKDHAGFIVPLLQPKPNHRLKVRASTNVRHKFHLMKIRRPPSQLVEIARYLLHHSKGSKLQSQPEYRHKVQWVSTYWCRYCTPQDLRSAGRMTRKTPRRIRTRSSFLFGHCNAGSSLVSCGQQCDLIAFSL